MGSSQMLASKNSQENVNSNNARSVDDCSAQGVSLQRKAITMQGNSNVMQRMAWVAIKPLDALYSSSASSTSAPEGKRKPYEPLTIDKSSVDKGNAQGWNKKRKRLDYNKNDHQTHHRHFIFSPLNPDMPPSKEELDVQKEIRRLRNKSEGKNVDNNIGYGCDYPIPWLLAPGVPTIKGKGILFSEDAFNRGYTVKEQVSDSPEKDKKLLNAMKSYIPSQSWRYAVYDLVLSNCQDWVEDVRKKAGI